MIRERRRHIYMSTSMRRRRRAASVRRVLLSTVTLIAVGLLGLLLLGAAIALVDAALAR